MSHDNQMIRGEVPGGFNLSVGEPHFLQNNLHWTHVVGSGGPVCYPSLGGESELVEAIRDKMEIIYPHGNTRPHVIVANGAKQALAAVLYAWSTSRRAAAAVHPVPHWPSYPTLVKAAGLRFYTEGAGMQLRTGPNNPDGSISVEGCDMWDAAYAHPVYGWDGVPSSASTSVWSAAKLYGLSGLRVGWVCTWDDEIAKHAAYFVEITTSGVCTTAQRTVAEVIRREITNSPEIKYSYAEARAALTSNGLIIRNALEPHCDVLEGVSKPLGPRRGMFSWVKVKDPARFDAALTQAKVKFVTGQACGMTEPGWYRISAGHRTQYTIEAMDRLVGALK